MRSPSFKSAHNDKSFFVSESSFQIYLAEEAAHLVLHHWWKNCFLPSRHTEVAGSLQLCRRQHVITTTNTWLNWVVLCNSNFNNVGSLIISLNHVCYYDAVLLPGKGGDDIENSFATTSAFVSVLLTSSHLANVARHVSLTFATNMYSPLFHGAVNYREDIIIFLLPILDLTGYY
jgi:hypothetical protein